MRTLAVLLIVAGCSKQSEQKPEQQKPKPACIADDLEPLRNELDFEHPCEQSSCKEPCAKGDAIACVLDAYKLEGLENEPAAREAFMHACQLGIAIACTNAAAHIWSHQHTDDELACAKRLFEAACDADETMGCGMAGRMRADDAKTDEQRMQARFYFEKVCDTHGGASCRMFAFHLEKGDLGTHTEAEVKTLMQRACDTGDEEACGHKPDETMR